MKKESLERNIRREKKRARQRQAARLTAHLGERQKLTELIGEDAPDSAFVLQLIPALELLSLNVETRSGDTIRFRRPLTEKFAMAITRSYRHWFFWLDGAADQNTARNEATEMAKKASELAHLIQRAEASTRLQIDEEMSRLDSTQPALLGLGLNAFFALLTNFNQATGEMAMRKGAQGGGPQSPERGFIDDMTWLYVQRHRLSQRDEDDPIAPSIESVERFIAILLDCFGLLDPADDPYDDELEFVDADTLSAACSANELR